eukprot:813376-Amphidinium_carterae.1
MKRGTRSYPPTSCTWDSNLSRLPVRCDVLASLWQGFATIHWSGNPDWVLKAANIDLPGLLGFRQRVNRRYVAQGYVK